MSDFMTPRDRPPRDPPEGIGGWLVLPLLGLILTPVGVLVEMAGLLYLLDVWSLLPLSVQFFIGGQQLGIFLLFVCAPVALLVFMVMKLEIFPGWYIVWSAALPIFLIGNALVAHALVSGAVSDGTEELFDKDILRAILRSIVGAAIWIPYMMRSERVANTFTQ